MRCAGSESPPDAPRRVPHSSVCRGRHSALTCRCPRPALAPYAPPAPRDLQQTQTSRRPFGALALSSYYCIKVILVTARMDTMDSTEIKTENPDSLEIEPEDFNVDSDAMKLEFSEVGDPVPFKIIKVEHDNGESDFQMEVPVQSEWIADAEQHQAGPSNLEQLATDSRNSSRPPPNKCMKTDTKLSTTRPVKRPKRLRLENNESMEIMSSDDDAFSTESDMEYGNDSESDSACEYFSDDDPLYTGPQDDRNLDGVNIGLSENRPVWTDESSMKKHKFTKKRELLIPPPKAPYDTFCWFLNDQILDTIVNETNKYGSIISNKKKLAPTSRFRAWKDVTREEMTTFLALLIHTGTIRTNRISDYWRGDYLFNFNCFSRFMNRNRFMLILNCLNVGTLNPKTRAKDNISKISPVINNFNEKMKEIYYPGKELLIAKSMVFWHGRLVRQEYTDHRRHKNAINLFKLAEPNGTVVKFQVYAGLSIDNIYRVTTGKIVEDLLEDKLGSGHSVYMDRYYSSYKLARTLLENQTYCTGTLNKKTIHNPFRETQELNSNKSFFSNGVHIGKWRGHKSILYITTEFKDQLHQFTEKNGTLNHRPKALANFSKFMTGTELQDQLMSYMPCNRKRMHWYKKVFIYALQIYMSNAFHLFNNYSGIKKKMGYYEYRLAVLRAMLPLPEPTPPMYEPPVPLALNHALTKITRTRLREKKERDGTVRIVNEVLRKECKPCRRRKRRTATLYECAACEGSPAFCTTCFCEAHVSTNTPYTVDFDL